MPNCQWQSNKVLHAHTPSATSAKNVNNRCCFYNISKQKYLPFFPTTASTSSSSSSSHFLFSSHYSSSPLIGDISTDVSFNQPTTNELRASMPLPLSVWGESRKKINNAVPTHEMETKTNFYATATKRSASIWPLCHNDRKKRVLLALLFLGKIELWNSALSFLVLVPY